MFVSGDFMYLKTKDKNIELIEAKNIWQRFKSLKFVLEPINYGIKFPHKRFCNTNFLCQRIDIILTDKNDKILYMYENFGTEKYIHFKFKVYNTYFLPLNTVSKYKIGDTLEIVLEKEEQLNNKNKKELNKK